MRSTGSWYEAQYTDEAGKKHDINCRIRGKLKLRKNEFKSTNPIAVGDWVAFEWENETEKIGNITDIVKRENYIIRKSVHKTAHAHILASNIDQAIMIATLAYPRTSLGFIDRFLVTAEGFRIPSVIVFNKADLLSEEDKNEITKIMSIYEKLGYKTLLTSTLTGEGIEEFKNLLKDKKSLLSGHSGVGKTTIINKISPQTLLLATKEISDFSEKGKHTTTFATMYELFENTYIIDSPGIKELGIMEITKEQLAHYFPEMRAELNNCKYNNCLHLKEPKCAIKELLESGTIAQSRYESYLSILEDEDTYR
jgi:ribosome biogenesis GTPase / thiamine phosphate phosphatase